MNLRETKQTMTWCLAGLLISLGVLAPAFSGGDFGGDSGAGSTMDLGRLEDLGHLDAPLADNRPGCELPSGHELPPGCELPPDHELPSGCELPSDHELPSGCELPSDHDGEPQVDLGRVPVLLLDRAPTNGDAKRLLRTSSPEERTARWEVPFPKIAPTFVARYVHPEGRHYWAAPKIRNLHWPHGPPLLVQRHS